MSEEEKKAIENFKEIIENLDEDEQIEYEEEIQDYKTLINLIGNQQKEIEEKTTILLARSKKVKQLEKEIEELKAINQIQKYRIEVINERELISKDKIREKIEELESLSKNITMQPSIYNYEIDLLKELLEE